MKETLKEMVKRIIKEELNEAKGMSLEQAKAEAKRESKENGYCVQHVNKLSDGSYEVSDWYDDEKTVWSCGN